MSIDRLAGVVLAASIFLTFTLACGDGDGDGGGSTGPDPTGSIEVSLTVAGDAPDADGCVFTVDGATQRRILSGESTTYTGLSVGQHEVAISDVAGNCQVQGDAVRSVSVVADQTATVPYAVTCAEAVGSIDVHMTTEGEDQDPDGYEVVLDGGMPSAIGINGTLLVGGLAVGDHTLTIEAVAANCTVGGGNPRTLAVEAGQTTHVPITVTCSSTSGSMAVSASTAGEDIDPDGYEVVIEGGAPSAIGINGSMTIGGLAPGDYWVELQGEAFNCDVGDSNYRSVTVTAGQETQVTFSVNCRYHLYNRIAFVSNRTGDYVIHAVEPQAGAPVRSLGLAGSTPAVSPDGLRIAYERNTDIYVANSDGTGETRLTNTGDDERYPAWSPDGSTIAYARWTPGPMIWLMSVDGSNQRSLGTTGYNPTWSPDGSRIAFEDAADIFIINSDGSGRWNLTNHTAAELSPAWSPLGNLVAFESSRSGAQVWVQDPAGGPATNMTGGLVPFARNPSWAPAAAAGAFETDMGTGMDIFFFDPSVPELVQLTTNAAFDGSPSWGGGN